MAASAVAANSGVPAKPTRIEWERRVKRLSRELLLLAKLGFETGALERRQVLDEDLADQVVHFVLDAYREEPLGGEFERFATLVLRANGHPRRPCDLVVVAGYGEAAFLALGFAFGGEDFRID